MSYLLMTLTFPLRVKAGQLHSHKMQFASNDFTDLESCRKRQCGSKRLAQEYQKKSQLRVNPYIHHENENKCTDQHATTSSKIILSWFIVYFLASKWNQVQKYTWAGRIAIWCILLLIYTYRQRYLWQVVQTARLASWSYYQRKPIT